MTEAVEYRLKKNYAGLMIALALMFYTAGLITTAIGYTTAADLSGFERTLVASLVVVLYLHATLFYWYARALFSGGILRRLFERVFTEQDDPPLRNWCKDLEARGAFLEGDNK